MPPKPGEVAFRAALFVLPFALAFVYVVTVLAIVSAEAWPIIVGGMATYLLAPVGTEIVIPFAIVALQGVAAPPWTLIIAVVSIILVDVFMALFVAWNWDLLEGVPYLGGAVRRVEAKCREVIARRRWGEGATLTALAAYVALPVQMTGGLVGSVLGRVMGLDKLRVFLAVSAGSAAGAVPMAVVAVLAGPGILAALESPTVQNVGAAAGILITVAFIALVIVLYRRGKANAD